MIADELETLREEEERLVDLWKTSRDLPIVRAQLDNIRHERKLFEEKVKESRRSLPDMGHLPSRAPPPRLSLSLSQPLASRRGRHGVSVVSSSACAATAPSAPSKAWT